MHAKILINVSSLQQYFISEHMATIQVNTHKKKKKEKERLTFVACVQEVERTELTNEIE